MTCNSSMDMDDAINVYLRIKPEESSSDDNRKCFKVLDNKSLRVTIPPESYHFKINSRYHDFCDFQFSHIFPEDVTQKNVFKSVESVMKSFVDGVDGLIFNYGVTNSGKTHTLVGPAEDPGLFPRTLSYVFRRIKPSDVITKQTFIPHMYNNVIELSEEAIKSEERFRKDIFSQCETPCHDVAPEITFSTPDKDKKISEDYQETVLDENYAFFISIAQIYNESIFDLLSNSSSTQTPSTPQKSNSLKIREDSNGNSYIDGLRYVMVSSIQQALTVLRYGCKKRVMAETKMNMSSSRSHVIYSLKMVRAFQLSNNSQIQRVNELRFVDLAGSERQSKTLSYGKNLKEASHINLSLMVLGKCIKQLRAQRINPRNLQTVVSFRESKLTKLLQSFFIGQLSAVMIVNISPTIIGFDETFNVLRFSSLTKSALTRPVGVDFTQTVATEEVLRMDAEGDLQSYRKEDLIKFIVVLKQRILMLEEDSDVREEQLRDEFNELLQTQLKDLTSMNERRVKDECWNIETTYRTKIQILLDQISELQQLNELNSQESQKVTESFKESNQELETKSNRLTIELENTKKELERIRESLKKSESENVNLQEKYEEVQNDWKRHQKDHLEFQQHLDELKAQKDRVEMDHSKSEKVYEKQISTLKNEIDSLKKEISVYRTKENDLNAAVRDLENQMKSVMRENEDLKKKIDQKDQQISELVKKEIEHIEREEQNAQALRELSMNSKTTSEVGGAVDQLKIYKQLYEENNQTISRLEDYIHKLNQDAVMGSSSCGPSKKRRTLSMAGEDDENVPVLRKSTRIREKKT